MIGNSNNDIICGKNAGCNTVLLRENQYGQTLSSSNLLDAIKGILNG